MSFSNYFDFALTGGKLIEPESAYCSEQVTDSYTMLVSSNVKKNNDLKVSCLSGSGNFLYHGCNSECLNSKITISGNGNYIFLGPYSRLKGADIRIVGNGCLFYFGAFSTVESMTAMVYGEKSKIVIGDHNMFSARIMLDTSDHHSIYDLSTGMKINDDGDIFINDKVWLGRDVRVNKNTIIGHEVVVGQSSVVSGALNPNSIYAGVPARVVKSGIVWSRMKSQSISEMENSDRHLNFNKKINSLKLRLSEFS